MLDGVKTVEMNAKILRRGKRNCTGKRKKLKRKDTRLGCSVFKEIIIPITFKLFHIIQKLNFFYSFYDLA